MTAIIFLSGLLLFLFWTPYSLFHSVQLAYFLHPMHAADPSFLARDWYTSQTAAPHPFFSSLIELLIKHHGLEPGLFIIHILQFGLILCGLLRLVRLFSDDWRTSVLTVFFIFFYFSDGLAQSSLYSPIVQASDFAVPFYLFSLIFLFEQKIILSCFFLALSGLIHIHFAIDGVLVLILFMIFNRQGVKVKTYVSGLILFTALILPGILPLIREFNFSAPLTDPSIFKLFFYFRSPHHYAPTTFELSHTVRVVFPFLFIVSQPKTQKIRAAASYGLIVLGLCLLAALSIQPFYFPVIARLFFFRLSPFVLILGFIFMSIYLIRSLDAPEIGRKILVFLFLTVCLLEKDSRLFILLNIYLLVLFRLHDRLKITIRKRLAWFYALPVAVLFLMTHRQTDLLFNSTLSLLILFLLSLRPLRTSGRILIVFAVLWMPALCLHFRLPLKYPWYRPAITPEMEIAKLDPDLLEICRRIEELTPPDALLLSPPYTDGIRFYAKRAIIVDLHANPYGSAELQEWHKRLETVSQTTLLKDGQLTVPTGLSAKDFLRQAYLKLNTDQIKSIARQYGSGYFLTEKSAEVTHDLTTHGYKLLAENSTYVLFQLKEKDS